MVWHVVLDVVSQELRPFSQLFLGDSSAIRDHRGVDGACFCALQSDTLAW